MTCGDTSAAAQAKLLSSDSEHSLCPLLQPARDVLRRLSVDAPARDSDAGADAAPTLAEQHAPFDALAF
jgi:hypothetical protein